MRRSVAVIGAIRDEFERGLGSLSTAGSVFYI